MKNVMVRVMEQVIIYGIGGYFAAHKDLIYSRYHVVALVDGKKTGSIDGLEIVRPYDIEDYLPSKVIIMVTDIKEIIKIGRALHKQNDVDTADLLIGISLLGHTDKFELSFTDQMNLDVKTDDGMQIVVTSFDEYANMMEVFREGSYHYNINSEKQEIVLDVGMNIAAATLYFLRSSKVKAVYGFEPFPGTFETAKINIKKNHIDTKQVKMFAYGLSNSSEIRRVRYNPDISCGMSTLSQATMQADKNYEKMGLLNIAKDEYVNVQVRKSSEVVLEIVDDNPECNLVLKLDCEGEEYSIIDDLNESGMLSKFAIIMMEWHYKGKDSLLKTLSRNGFSYFAWDKSKAMGLIYAYRS